MKGKKQKEPVGFNPAEIFAALALLEKERGIPQSFMMEKIVQALTTAYKRDHADVENVIVDVDEAHQNLKMFVQKNVVEEEDYVDPANEMPIEEAQKLGATALFSEKYGDVVRVVNMGGYSVEFCGGTHLDNTAKVGPFEIESECSVASGVRRIEAFTGKLCLKKLEANRALLSEVSSRLKVKPLDLANRLQSHMDEIKELRRAIEQYRAKESAGEVDRFLFGAHEIKGLRVMTTVLPKADPARLRQMGDMLRDKEPNVVAVLASVKDDKPTFLAVCGKEAVKHGIKAGELVKLVCTACGGSGGGKPDSAMGGGTEVSKVDDALAAVDDFVAGKL